MTLIFELMKMKLIFLCACFLIFLCKINAQNDIRPALQEISLRHDLLGSSLVLFNDEHIIAESHYGKSDYPREIATNTQTLYRVASISKLVTAIAMMQLIEKNVCSLDKDISQILRYSVQNPAYPHNPITIRMLLSHTSSITDSKSYSQFISSTTNEKSIPNLCEILDKEGIFYSELTYSPHQPGTYFQYSNINYVIVATIIEKITRERFDHYCKKNIFNVLGLKASFNPQAIKNVNNIAVLYRKKDGQWLPQLDNYKGKRPKLQNLSGYIAGTNAGRLGPQGSLRSSARDIAKIMISLNTNPQIQRKVLLRKSTVDTMYSSQWIEQDSNGNNYNGLFRNWGLGVHRLTGLPNSDIALPYSRLMLGHCGEAYGLISAAYYDPERKLGFVFITNGVGKSLMKGNKSAFYTVEEDVFDAVENYFTSYKRK